FNEVKNNLNVCIGALNELVSDVGVLADAGIEGRLDTRADVSKHGGDFGTIMGGINGLMNSLVGHIDSVPAPVMIIDKDFTVNYLNPAGASVAGRSRTDAVGGKCYDLFQTSDCNTPNCACGQAMQQIHEVTSETDAHPNGLNLDISYSGSPLKDMDGNVIGAIEIVTDQTAVKQAARLAQKISDFQDAEVLKVVESLNKLALGDLNANLDVAMGDEDTTQTRETFMTISKGISQTIDGLDSVIGECTEVLGAVQDGNLTRNVRVNGVGDFKALTDGIENTRIALHDIVDTVRTSAENVASSSEELSASSEEMSSGADEIRTGTNEIGSSSEQVSKTMQEIATGNERMSEKIKEIVSAMADMSSSVEQVATNSQELAENADELNKGAATAGDATNQLVVKMDDIKGAVGDSAELIKELDQKSSQIGEIVSMITNIADQTNLLALNAAIEAARAGEHGRGFAVVADEVRKLAEESGGAAKQIASLIGEVQEGTAEAVTSMDTGAEQVVEGVEALGVTAADIQTIVENVGEMSRKIQEVAAAAEEQSAGVEEVTSSVEEISTAAAQSAAGTEEASAAAEEQSASVEQQIAAIEMQVEATVDVSKGAEQLSALGEQLQAIVGKFVLDSAGSGSSVLHHEVENDVSADVEAMA
ncbi:MAG: methyl-accepting chemotaxis protein, partial [Gammaproteobacteria bacterium]|nr:methyl-accepting chemotaxis protein [Gammaproteobacteria bacterium]